MCQHETKYCARCNFQFECRVGSILLCQCAEVDLNDQERDYLKALYNDCLCTKCMREIKSEFHNTTNHYDTLFGGTAMPLMDEVSYHGHQIFREACSDGFI